MEIKGIGDAAGTTPNPQHQRGDVTKWQEAAAIIKRRKKEKVDEGEPAAQTKPDDTVLLAALMAHEAVKALMVDITIVVPDTIPGADQTEVQDLKRLAALQRAHQAYEAYKTQGSSAAGGSEGNLDVQA